MTIKEKNDIIKKKQKGYEFMFNYNKLWKKLIDHNLKKTDLIRLVGISSATLAKMRSNQAVSMDTLAKICMLLNCDLSDIVTISQRSQEC